MPHFLGSDAVDAALLTAGAALCGALITAAITWAKDLGRTAKRSRVLDEGIKSVQFWESWYGAIEAVSTDAVAEKKRAEKEIRRSADRVRVQLRGSHSEGLTEAEFREYRAQLPAWRRLLLLYREPDDFARMMRTSIYLLIVMVGIMTELVLHFFARKGLLHRYPIVLWMASFLYSGIAFAFGRRRALNSERKYVEYMDI